LTLLSSLPTLNAGLNDQYAGTITADLTKIGLWGHSYGGQVTLAVLAISGLTYPTVLWAPVSVTFPYSILFYTDDFDDHGKSLRRLLAEFEADYDSELFSPPNFYSWIKAPVQIHQGTADESVPSWWSDRLAAMLKKNPVRLDYFVYPGADHNLRPSGWTTAVQRSITFYTNQLR
jgi:dipeptidyl aminopeptidase/acylaminoacyl peptidase